MKFQKKLKLLATIFTFASASLHASIFQKEVDIDYQHKDSIGRMIIQPTTVTNKANATSQNLVISTIVNGYAGDSRGYFQLFEINDDGDIVNSTINNIGARKYQFGEPFQNTNHLEYYNSLDFINFKQGNINGYLFAAGECKDSVMRIDMVATNQAGNVLWNHRYHTDTNPNPAGGGGVKDWSHINLLQTSSGELYSVYAPRCDHSLSPYVAFTQHDPLNGHVISHKLINLSLPDSNNFTVHDIRESNNGINIYLVYAEHSSSNPLHTEKLIRMRFIPATGFIANTIYHFPFNVTEILDTHETPDGNLVALTVYASGPQYQNQSPTAQLSRFDSAGNHINSVSIDGGGSHGGLDVGFFQESTATNEFFRSSFMPIDNETFVMTAIRTELAYGLPITSAEAYAMAIKLKFALPGTLPSHQILAAKEYTNSASDPTAFHDIFVKGPDSFFFAGDLFRYYTTPSYGAIETAYFVQTNGDLESVVNPSSPDSCIERDMPNFTIAQISYQSPAALISLNVQSDAYKNPGETFYHDHVSRQTTAYCFGTPVSREEVLLEKKKVNVFPNPLMAADELTIEGLGPDFSGHVSIHNVHGQLAAGVNHKGNQLKITEGETLFWSAGIYLIHAVDESGASFRGKFQVIR